MPLGKLSKKQIQSAYSVLTELQQVSWYHALFNAIKAIHEDFIENEFGEVVYELIITMVFGFLS